MKGWPFRGEEARARNRRSGATTVAVSVLLVSAFVGAGVVAAVTDTGMVSDGNLDQANNDGGVGLCQWVEVEQLFVPLDPSEPNGFSIEFGRSVAIDGETAVVGAVGFYGVTGATYVYDLTEDSPTPTKLVAGDGAPDDLFGVSVDISGDTVAVGASAHDAMGEDSGAVYVYDLTDSTAETKLVPSDAEAGDRFGDSVAVDGDTLVVGARGADGSTGAVYVYDLANPTAPTKLTASDGETNDRFGSSVAVDGETVLVGADGAGTGGAAYVYDLANPTAGTKLVGSGLASLSRFGASVALSGETAVVGALGLDGSVHVYDLRQDPPSEDAVITGGSAFGKVALSGETLIVGSPGAIALYDLSSAHPTVPIAEATGISDQFGSFGSSVAVDGETALVGEIFGPVSVFRCVD